MDYISQNAPESRFMPILQSGKMNPSSIPQNVRPICRRSKSNADKNGDDSATRRELLDQADFFESRGLPAEDLHQTGYGHYVEVADCKHGFQSWD